MPDLLQSIQTCDQSLDGRLHFLYPSGYEKVVLHLEQLIYSHQHAQTHRDQVALQDITSQILWWLGYGVTIHPANAKIFVVDDTIETLKLVTTLLTKAGYKTDSALNGKLALEKIPWVNPDLIILDVNLPDINGYQVYEKLQKIDQLAQIPVVFLSGVDSINEILSQYKRRVGYLTKPFKPQGLLKCVHRYLKVRAPGHTFSDDVLADELASRQHYAAHLLCLSKQYPAREMGLCDESIENNYFFRTTLDGRYLRVSQRLAELHGYRSSEEMIANVTNVWQQIYDDTAHQEQWSICLQSPNTAKSLSTKIKTKHSKRLNVTEKISLVQDNYHRNLFYEGYLCLK